MKTIGSSAAMGLVLVMMVLVLTLQTHRCILGSRWYCHRVRRCVCTAGVCGRFTEYAFHLRIPAGTGYRG